MTTLRVALAQLPSAVGAFADNVRGVADAMTWAERCGADLLLTPEMTVTGYPADDLLADPAFLAAAERAVNELSGQSGSTVTLLGTPLPNTAHARAVDASGRALVNGAVAVQDGARQGDWAKTLLPTYSVFDDARQFAAGVAGQPLLDINGVACGVLICEDIWTAELAQSYADRGAQLLLSLNASPYVVGKPEQRLALLTGIARATGCPILYVNAVGGQDEIVFDGSSLVIDADGTVLAGGAAFTPDRLILDLDVPAARPRHGAVTYTGPAPDRKPEIPAAALPAALSVEEQVYTAAVVGLRSYFARTGFSKAVLGLSGGIDSALVATIAVDALGRANVHGIGMPGPFSSDGSVSDARDLADNLGISFDVISIRDGYTERLAAMGDVLLDADGNSPAGAAVARENLQARLRAVTLMTYANTFSALMVPTGNSSESACGFFTYGGDSLGTTPNPIGDLYKETVTYSDGVVLPGVFALARWRNRHALTLGDTAPIPESTLTKPPSAELAEGQQDSDSLPPYPILDAVLLAYLEEHATPDELVTMLTGPRHQLDLPAAHAIVTRILALIARSEWKRRQVPYRIKVSRVAFGRDRFIPIATRWVPAPNPLATLTASRTEVPA